MVSLTESMGTIKTLVQTGSGSSHTCCPRSSQASQTSPLLPEPHRIAPTGPQKSPKDLQVKIYAWPNEGPGSLLQPRDLSDLTLLCREIRKDGRGKGAVKDFESGLPKWYLGGIRVRGEILRQCSDGVGRGC